MREREREREGEGMRNVLIPRGSEQTAKEWGVGGGTEERQREEIREPKRLETGRKQDLQLSCPVWALHTAADGFRSWKTTTSPRLGAHLKLSKEGTQKTVQTPITTEKL